MIFNLDCPKNKMLQRITCASNEDIMKIKEMLLDRVKKHKKELRPEYDFIKELKDNLENYCTGKDVSIKIVMLREFANDLQNIINIYDNIVPTRTYKRRKSLI